MIVIDIGCAQFQGACSMPKLMKRFKPDVLYGFDPRDDEVPYEHEKVVRSRAAAWKFDGAVGFKENGTTSRILESHYSQVPCIDLARFISELDDEIVLKLDCEGSEYGLLKHLRARGIDEHLSLVLVEWHGSTTVRLRCPVEAW